jgi:hypothetical protein
MRSLVVENSQGKELLRRERLEAEEYRKLIERRVDRQALVLQQLYEVDISKLEE